MDAGGNIVNVATASALGAANVSATATVRVEQRPSLSVTKTGDRATVDAANTSIAYEVVVRNTGNVLLVNVQVDDALVESDGARLVCFPVPQGGSLPVGGSTKCTGVYTTSQQDMDVGGEIVNVASVHTEQTQRLEAVFATRVVQRPQLSVTKTADRPSISRAKDVILYRIEIVNRGNVQVPALQVIDPLLDGAAPNDLQCTPVPRGGTLGVGAQTTCTGSFVATQETINAGAPVVNVVTVRGAGVQVEARVSTPVVQLPGLTVRKEADRLTVDTAGQVIRYTIYLNNSGNVDLNNIQVSDALVEAHNNDLRCGLQVRESQEGNGDAASTLSLSFPRLSMLLLRSPFALHRTRQRKPTWTRVA